MLGGKMSNQDEDEVEDALEAMEREVNGVPTLPDASSVLREDMPGVPEQTPSDVQKERWKKRAARERNPEPLPA